MSQDPENSGAMLAEIKRSQDAVRNRVAKASWRYQLVYSAFAAVMVGGQVAPMPLNVLASAGSAGVLMLLWRRWSEKTGVSVMGYTPKHARWVAILLGGLIGGLMLAGVYAGRTGHYWWGAPLAVSGFVLAMILSSLWMRVYRAETAYRP